MDNEASKGLYGKTISQRFVEFNRFCNKLMKIFPPILTEVFLSERIKINDLRNVNVFLAFCAPDWSDEKVSLNVLPSFWWSHATAIWILMFELSLTRIQNLDQYFAILALIFYLSKFLLVVLIGFQSVYASSACFISFQVMKLL